MSGESDSDDSDPTKTIEIYSTKGVITRKKLEITKDVEFIDIAFSEIIDIEPDAFCAQPKVKTMIINGNDKFPPITKDFFKYLPNLDFFRVYNNEDLQVDIKAFSQLKYLKTLILNDVKIDRLTKDMFKNLDLTTLTLEGDDITEIDADAFSTLSNLVALRLGNNKLTTIKPGTFKNLSNLNELLIHKNNIGDLKWNYLDPLPSLTYLDWADNKMKHFDISKIKEYFPKIVKINLGGTIEKNEEEEIKRKAKILNVNVGLRDYSSYY